VLMRGAREGALDQIRPVHVAAYLETSKYAMDYWAIAINSAYLTSEHY